MSNKGFWLAAIALLLSACNTSTAPNYPAPGGGGGTTTTTSTVSVIASPSSLPPTVPPAAAATSTITATVLAGGLPVADGTVVNFTLSSALFGSLSAASATTVGGDAPVTFTAGSTPGTVTVTATSGTASDITPITLTATPLPGGIQFVSATPGFIALSGSGQNTASTIAFRVTDANAAPAPGIPVTFSKNGPNGGEFLSTTTGTTDLNGDVSVVLNSGTVAGPATVTASASFGGPTPFTASSSTISIGGGVPSAAHFDLLVTRKNLPGLLLSNFHTTFTALLADRFGNYNVLAGTSVSFFTEAGAIDTSNVVDAFGVTTVDFRTQLPAPATVTANASDTTAITLASTYSITAPGFPRRGHVTVLATVRGEEGFADNNANGIFDTGDSVTGFDLGEAFIDENDTGGREAPEVFFNDVGGTTGYDGPNTVWDGPGCTGAAGPPVITCRTSPTIWVKHTIMFTGNITQCGAKPTTINVPADQTQTIKVMVSDDNLNRPVPGTTVSATISSGGKLLGPASYTIPDGVGPYEGQFVIGEAVPGTPGGAAQLTITVTAGNNEVFVTCASIVLTGTIN